MPQKQGSTQSKRDSKESKGTARGSQKVRLNELQKVLLVTGGMGHHLRKGQRRQDADGTKANRNAIMAAQASAARDKSAKRAQREESKESSGKPKRA